LMGPSTPAPRPQPVAPPVQPSVSAPAAEPDAAARYLAYGDFERLRPLLDSSGAEPTGEALTARGEGRRLSYLEQKRAERAAPKLDDEEVKRAMEDFTNAKTAEATFWIGQIREQTGDLAGAKKTYEEALKQFAANPAEQRLFQAALDRLEA